MLTPMDTFLLLRQQMPFPSLNIVSRLRLQHFRSASSHAGEHAQGRRRVGLQLPFPEPRLCGLRDAAGKGLRRCGLITRQKGEEGEKKGGIASRKREEMREEIRKKRMKVKKSCLWTEKEDIKKKTFHKREEMESEKEKEKNTFQKKGVDKRAGKKCHHPYTFIRRCFAEEWHSGISASFAPDCETESQFVRFFWLSRLRF